MVTNNAIAEHIIKSCEGLSLKPYICTGGMKTIGYGHVIKPNEQQQLGKQISKDEAEYLLKQDIQKARSSLYKYCQVPLNLTQEAALISFIFNCGSGAFQASGLRQKLNRGEYVLAADELLKWVYARGIKLSGLVKRRRLEREVFLDGMDIYPYDLTVKYNGEISASNKEQYGLALLIKNLFYKLRMKQVKT